MVQISLADLGLRAFDANGFTVSGALCYVYDAGTTTPVTTYSDKGLTTPQTSPVPANANGAFPEIYVPSGVYKVDLTDDAGASLPGFPKDNLPFVFGSFSISARTRAEVAALARLLQDGTVIWLGTLPFEVLDGSTAIDDIPNVIPAGDKVYPEHFAENTTPGTTDMTEAMQAASDYGDTPGFDMFPTDYFISDAITLTGRNTAGEPEGIRLVGAGHKVTRIHRTDHDNDFFLIEKGNGNTAGWLTGVVSGFSLLTSLNDAGSRPTRAQEGAGLRLRRCLSVRLDDIYMDAPTFPIVSENSSQCLYTNCYFRNNLRTAGQDAGSLFLMDSGPGGRSFGNFVSNVEAQSGEAWEAGFDLRSVDGLYISNSHINNMRKRFWLRPDNTGGRDKAIQVMVSNSYFDGDVTDGDFLYIEAPDDGALGETINISGIYINGCLIRTGNNVLKLANAAGELGGLNICEEIIFADNEIQDFTGRWFVTGGTTLADPVAKIQNIKVSGNLIEDGPANAVDNSNCFAIEGRNVQITDNIIQGNWTDAGEKLLSVQDGARNVVFSGNLIDAPQTTFYSINASALNVRRWGNCKDGETDYVVEVVEEGTSGGMDYRVFADGRAEVEYVLSTASQDCNTASGSSFRSGVVSPGVFPITFADPPAVSAIGAITDTAAAAWASFAGNLPTTTQWGSYYMMSTASSTSRTHTFHLTARGYV